MNDEPLHELTITELAGRIRSGELSPVALTEHLLALRRGIVLIRHGFGFSSQIA